MYLRLILKSWQLLFLLEIQIHLKMKKLQNIGKKQECLCIKSLICEQKIIDEVLVLCDLVVLIQKYFTELGKLSFHQKIPILKQMKITGWKYGIMSLCNFIVMIQVNLPNSKIRMSIQECDLKE